jgi:hypothetical protein
MPANVYPSQAFETRLVRETAYGVTPGSPTYKRLNGFGVRMGATIETDPFAAPGQLVPAIVMVNDDYSTGDVEGRLDFNALMYIFSGLFGPASTTSLGSGAYEHVWTWGGRRPNRPVSYTIHNGFPESANVATGFVFNSMSVGGGRSDGFDVSGDGFAKALLAGQALGGVTNEAQTVTITGTPTGGSFTLTFNGETTATILYNANAATVQTALEGLASIEPGDVVVTGGPGPGTPYVVTFTGYYAGQNVTQMTAAHTFTGGTTPNVAVTTTTPGADAVSDVAAIPAGAVLGNVYLDTTWAGLGTTQLLYVYDMNLDIGERMSRVRPINKSKSSDAIIDMADQDHTLGLTFGRNAVADAQLARLRAGTKIFPRIEWASDQIIGGAFTYLLQIDACIFYTEAGMPDDSDNASVVEYTGRLAIDDTSGNVISVKLRNGLATL